MQTKNINVEQAPLNNVSQKLLLINQQNTQNATPNHGAPPLPPRAAIIFTPLPELPGQTQVEVEGYGPYKPVPPPKPVPASSSPGCFTPPPYRMPPYPLYNEPSIPGATSVDNQPPQAVSTPQGLHTHSSKFPIEREVILSSADKNSKIPILNEYKKRSKVAIAPDVPPKQMAAWTQGQTIHQPHTTDMQNHSTIHIQSSQPANQQQQQDHNAIVYRATYHAPEYLYNGHSAGTSTGAVPRTQWHGTRSEDKPKQYSEELPQSVTVMIDSGKDASKEASKNNKSMTKTYHTLKDMISSRFKGGKEQDADGKQEEPGLNNVTEELRKSVRSVDRLTEEDDRAIRKSADQQGIYGKPRIDGGLTLQQQYTQHVLQQQQYRSPYAGHQLMQARSQEMLSPRSPAMLGQDGAYYHVTPQRSNARYTQQTPDQTYVMMHHPQFGDVKVNARDIINERCVDDRRAPEPRSAQQLERDTIRQQSFEARRTASQPQLVFDNETKSTRSEQKAQPSGRQPVPVRRGSHGNLIESCKVRLADSEKDSDDGGFISRSNSKERKLDTKTGANESADPQSHAHDDGTKVAESLTGTPRRRLEGEIGKIEGVYNVGQRLRTANGDTDIGEKRGSQRSANNGSGASSDYDKTGGQSSNADSGRGSAAYSSGRRMANDTSTESSDTHQLPSANYRDAPIPSGHDPEWVDIVENELRHILEPKLHELSLQANVGVANSTVSESISSMTPPLPPLSPGDASSPNDTPRNSTRYKHNSLPFGSKPDYGMDTYNKNSKGHTGPVGPGVGNSRWHNSNSTQKHRIGKKIDHSAMLKGKQIFGLDTTDITSTTTRSLDLESMLDGQSDSDGDISTTDARAIRKQLEGLESMYSEVLKLLGVKKHPGRYQPSDPRFSKRRYGSMSSLPSSSVSSRPIRDKRRPHDDRKKVKDIRGINKRFQRLESHVVTLARSVAHLSSEMRTQHLMIQEMENIRGEISALRTQTNMLSVRTQGAQRGPSTGHKDLPSLANPTRVKKLTKFFGDEPPLLRLFLKKLGYEKYANVFENERVGMVELPYLSEERLQKMGVPLGPRLRIMQEAQISVCKDTTLCIV